MLPFYQVAFLQFTLWGIRVALLKIIKFDAWLVARQIMFSIHIVAIAAVLCKRQLFSGVSVTHGTQANFSQGIQVHHPLRSQMCALFVAHPITAAQLIVVSALPHLAWLQSLHLWSHHLLPLLFLVATLVVATFLQLLPLLAKVMAIQFLHLPHYRPKCAPYVALPITIVLPAVVSAMPLLIWLKEWANQLPLSFLWFGFSISIVLGCFSIRWQR